LITLYQYPGGDGIGSISPPCLRVDLALRLLGVEFRRKDVRRPNTVAKLSGTGRLPLLDLDGDRFVESTRILDELERRHDVPWQVDDPVERANLRMWEYAFNDYFYWCGYYLRWVEPAGRRRFLDALFANSGWFTRMLIEKGFVPRQIKRARLHGSGGRSLEDIHAELERGVAMVATAVGSGPFLLGRATPSRADLTVTALLVQAGFHDAMPGVIQMIVGQELKPYLLRVCEACGGEVPRWLS